MIIDLDKYTVHKVPFVLWYHDVYKRPIGRLIADYAQASHCPCIVLSFYLGEAIGFNQELKDTIEILIKFYDYTDILNQSETSPYRLDGIIEQIKI